MVRALLSPWQDVGSRSRPHPAYTAEMPYDDRMVNALGQQASARQAGGPDIHGSAGPDDVIEGEFTEE